VPEYPREKERKTPRGEDEGKSTGSKVVSGFMREKKGAQDHCRPRKRNGRPDRRLPVRLEKIPHDLLLGLGKGKSFSVDRKTFFEKGRTFMGGKGGLPAIWREGGKVQPISWRATGHRTFEA